MTRSRAKKRLFMAIKAGVLTIAQLHAALRSAGYFRLSNIPDDMFEAFVKGLVP